MNRLLAAFGGDTRLDEISVDAAKDWRASMISEGLKEATARLHCRNAKTIFRDAVERELLRKSPVDTLKSSSIASDNEHFVNELEALTILEACPNVQWRLLFGLARLAGLRIPSESHWLSWDDVDWSKRRLTVYSEKTNQTRHVPIVPELYRILQDAFDSANDGQQKVMTLSRNNLHRDFKVILKRAGIIPWDELFQTLRRSAETQFARVHPQHAVSKWIGHSMLVSEKHYLSVTDDLYEAAAGMHVLGEAESAAAGHCIASHDDATAQSLPPLSEVPAQAKTRMTQQVAKPCGSVRRVGGAGIEPATPGFSILCSTN